MRLGFALATRNAQLGGGSTAATYTHADTFVTYDCITSSTINALTRDLAHISRSHTAPLVQGRLADDVPEFANDLDTAHLPASEPNLLLIEPCALLGDAQIEISTRRANIVL